MIIKAPNDFTRHLNSKKKIFLGGTIDNGNSEDWQETLGKTLSGEDYVVLSPRRDNWSPNATQSIDDLDFYKQVNWELNAMNCADIVLIYFAGNSKSPISLLELGLMANSGKVTVCCEPNFWRKGNVEIICEKFNIPLYPSIDLFVKTLFGSGYL